jgi:hypothetical protein
VVRRAQVVERIIEVAPGLHTAMTLPPKALRAMARHLGRRPIHNSAETGSGASTLLFSHFSRNHTVFAEDAGSGSIRNVEASRLLRPDVVRFIEGPTQSTLPLHRFAGKFQAVLLDGPHAYPFPDLEYYFFYPHLEPGALLIVDDIHIRSVHNLFDFLRQDRMFRLEEVVHSTAFFTRTDAPVFSPAGDGWWQQNYNRQPLFRYIWRERVKSWIPPATRRTLSRVKRRIGHEFRHPGCEVRIVRPRGDDVGASGSVEGTAAVGEGVSLWVLVRRQDLEGWWPQAGGPIPVCDGRWSVSVAYGEPQDLGHPFEICALVVGPTTTAEWLLWQERARTQGAQAPVALPPAEFVYSESYTTVRKARTF